jgi:alpha-galactosidase
MRDPVYPLGVDIVFDVFEDCDLFPQRALIWNEGSGQVQVDEALSAVVYARRGPSYRLTHLVGRWAGETQLERTMLAEGRTVLESRRGFTSHFANPFFALDPEGSSGEGHGDVYFGELAWSGNWKIALERDNSG